MGMLEFKQRFHNTLAPGNSGGFFYEKIGFSPKVFSRIGRYQKVLGAIKQTDKKHWGKIFYDFGYFDQAHFSKDFKEFYGIAPSQLNINL